VSTANAGYKRKWRQTPAGMAAVKARGRAQNAATSWVIANRPDVWAEILGDARVEAGLPRQGVPGRAPGPVSHNRARYVRGCRCDECCEANRQYKSEYRRRRL